MSISSSPTRMLLPTQSLIFVNTVSILGVRDQALDWMTAPPVHVLSYLVLGSEKDAKSSQVHKKT